MTARRVSTFVAVGAAGFIVQMSAAAVLLQAGIAPVVATMLAIEAAIVSNHVWHRQWAWRDRVDGRSWLATLWRAHLGAGGTSLVVGIGTVALLARHVPPLLAQALAVAVCAGVNYWLTDRWIFSARESDCEKRSRQMCSRERCSRERCSRRTLSGGLRVGQSPTPTLSSDRPPTLAAVLAVAGMLVAGAGPARADGPSPHALASWQRYVSAVERARAADDLRAVPAWATDEDRQGTLVRAAVSRGELHITRRAIAIDVDNATLEHWQGSLLLEGVTLAQVSERLRHPERYPQPADVLALEVSDRSDAGHDLYLRLTRSMLVSATYDTWHRVGHQSRGPNRVDSTSVATRIEEVQRPGTPSERRVRLEESRDFLWRMQSFWRFSAVPGGVIVTCESMTLSRPVPLGLGLVSRPIITRVARESMTTALRAWQRGWHAESARAAGR